jgi:uncharacterized protein
MKNLNRRSLLLIVTALLGLALWLGSSALVAWQLTRRGRPPFPEPPPEVAWGKLEAHRLRTSDDQEIGAWLVRGDRQKGCVLLLHGIGESRRQMLPVMRWLAEAHFTALAISLRGHGDSSGVTNDFGWSARHDVLAAVALLRRECPQQPIFIVGRSLGAATAIFSAKELDGKIAGYFLEQPFKDIQSAVWNRLHRQLPPGLDWLAYGGLRLWASVFVPVDPDQISPYDRVVDIPESVPVIFIAGTADQHALLGDVTALFERVQSHSELVVFEGATHVPLDNYDPQLYRRSLFALLDRR